MFPTPPDDATFKVNVRPSKLPDGTDAVCTDAPHAVMAAALAHVVRNQVEAAYARSDLLERRRVLMEQRAEFPAVGNRNA